MTAFRPTTAALIWAILGCLTIANADDAARESAFHESLVPLLRTYCLDCHDEGSEVSLADTHSALDITKNRDLWIRALAQVRLGSMPPADGDMMDAANRLRMEKLIDELANAVDCVQNPNAGKVALRRLNRIEYRNTIRDLTDVDYEPSDGFPGDDVGYGFDNIGDVLSLPPVLIEKYLDAAEVISGKAIYTPPPGEIYELDKTASDLIGAEDHGGGSGRVVIASNGTVSLQPTLPFGGNYTITITASGDQGGPDPCRMSIQSGRFEKIIDVPEKDAADYEVTMRLGKGTRKIDISFINDYYKDGQDRNLHLHHVHVRGEERRPMFIDTEKLPPSHRRIVFANPGEKLSEDQASAAVLSRFASRAFRRPATAGEVQRLVQLAQTVRQEGGSYEEGLQVAMQAILVSPHFLFKVEQHRSIGPSGKMPPISDYELATRISYFLWSSMPDDELLLLAHRGEIRDRRKLLDKVARMMRDPRCNRFVENFAGQWLQLRNLDNVNPDTRIFRAFDDEVRELMRRETLTFFAAVMRGNLPVTTLLDADFTYLNETLAKYYGIPGVSGDHFRRVSLAGTPRGGLLTHASILTVTSNPTRTSPVKRGKWILDNLLNMPPPPAPPNIPELEKSRLVGTLRQRMEQHRDNPACAACHNMMDPLGFALENFDAVGQWRSRDGRDEIDASGALPDGTEFKGVEDLRRLLSTDRREQFVRCLAEKLLIYGLGRGTEYYDKCAIDQIVADVDRADGKFAYLLVAIIESEPFQKQGHRE
ncbi:DUF1592 domain-containing protein [Rubripirellula lacrimiformis]|uniref:DUF1592 domain-containing protein n=1 Tax=Rubripirellula lacrimiformis TaxID=1930273 RepID=UPI001FED1A9E|nr:DUF1592 domain-containing protein [Rubripirellula lacrimiformis]